MSTASRSPVSAGVIDYDAVAEAVSPDQLARALGARKVGNGWQCPSPDHEDADPSFSFFREGKRTAGKCHGCGLGGSPVSVASQVWGVSMNDAAERLVRHLGIFVASTNGNGANRPEIVDTYDYTDEDGGLIFQAVRFHPKDFRQRRPDGRGGWTWKLGDVRRMLYRLPALLEAVAMDKLVHVVEGEKDVHAVEKAGGVATCNPMGAGKWRPEYSETLRGAHVRIVADLDENGQGRDHARQIAGSLAGIVAGVEIVQARAGKDAADHLAAGHGLDDFEPVDDVHSEPNEEWPEHPRLLVDEVEGIDVSGGRYPPANETPEEEADSDSPTLTDTGNAARLERMHGHRLRYVPPWALWLVCGEDGFWILDHRDVRVRELAKDVGRKLKTEAGQETDPETAKRVFSFAFRTLNAKGISGLVDLTRGIDGIPLDHEQLDADGWLLGVENGVVDLHTGELRQALPPDLLTRRCPVIFDAEAEAPRWHQTMEQWFPDPEVRAYVQRVAGSALVGAQRDHIFVIHYGTGGNGKGTFLRALQRVLGPYALEIHLSLLVESKYKEHDTVRADLFRTRLAVAVETDRRVRLAEASVKNLTGADRIRARRMREDPWSFDPSHSLWLQTNHLPEISGRDTGIWRRIRVVKWVNTFTGKDEDRGLDEALAAEVPGIMAWLVRGCLAWQEYGLAEPEAVIRDTLAYRRAEDTFTRFQEDVGLVFKPDLRIQAGELQELLAEWATGEGIDPPRHDLGEWLRDQGCRQKRKKWTDPASEKLRQARFWLGVGIEDGNHESEQTHAL